MLRHFLLRVRFGSRRKQQLRVGDSATLHVRPFTVWAFPMKMHIEHGPAPVGNVAGESAPPAWKPPRRKM